MGRFASGQSVTRLEDPRLLTGNGLYTDDVCLEGQAHSLVLRSPHAHARITGIAVDAARQATGVLAVYLCEDLDAARVGDIRCLFSPSSCQPGQLALTTTPILARGKVRMVGDPVAFVVAETMAAAREALELIEVDYEPLDCVSDAQAARDGSGDVIWDEAENNVCFVAELGSRQETDAAFAAAAHRVALKLEHNRVVVNSMECRGAIGDYRDGRFVLRTGSQGVHFVRDQLTRDIFCVPNDQVLVLTDDVGGGFGMKSGLYREQVLVLFAARALGRPVKWIGERSADAFVSDTQGRDQVDEVELALDEQHRFLGLRVRSVSNMGAYLSNFGPGSSTDFQRSVYSGPYLIPTLHAEITGMYTNTVSIEAYRGAGRPECAYRLERVIDAAARTLAVDALELRRKNLIASKQMPYTTPLGAVYDSGEFAKNLENALEHGCYDNADARKRASLAFGKLRGVGVSYYIEGCGGASTENAVIDVDASGSVTLAIGTQSNGQGHETAYAQLVADHLDIDIARVSVIQGDSERVKTGGGTTGSRSIPMGSPCCVRAAAALIDTGLSLASEQLEVAVEDLSYRAGLFEVAGTDVSIDLSEIAQTHDGLRSSGEFSVDEKTYPNGCHLCEVDVDPETGVVEIVKYLVVDDFGTVLNPMLLAGQVHGGIAQGAGQALYEHTVYDSDSAQLLSGSFMDYCIPPRRQPGIHRHPPKRRRAMPDKPVGFEGWWRGRHNRRASRHRRRRRRCVVRLRRVSHRHATHSGKGVARHACSTSRSPDSLGSHGRGTDQFLQGADRLRYRVT